MKTTADSASNPITTGIRRSQTPQGSITSDVRPDASGNFLNPANCDNDADECDEAHLDNTGTAGALNTHTRGIEFYGKSSDFRLLQQLMAHASQQKAQDTAEGASPSLSDFLYDVNLTGLEPPELGPVTVAGRKSDMQQQPTGQSSTPQRHLPAYTRDSRLMLTSNVLDSKDSRKSLCWIGQPMLLEMEYVSQYFENLHYALPILSPRTFKARCHRDIWAKTRLEKLPQERLHFLALYNAVLAVGALTAGPDKFRFLREELDTTSDGGKIVRPERAVTSIQLSRIYFGRAILWSC